ncbi:MAG TPA: alpha-L-arabinofuranosidase C-terminal domain-containing protein [Candidatus Acidoferrum sp.]|nr:alpha-L-arabinofuranosidase C-terminal domain-containing protein [Candidatus Acidoferrum sp.]
MTSDKPARRDFLKSGVTAVAGAAACSLVSPAHAWAHPAAALESPSPAAPTARIKLDFERQIGQIDRNIYGNFTEHLGRCIYGGIYDEGSLLSDSDGFRKDVLEAARGLHISVLRWPGGNFSSGYNWKDGIGPKDSRPRRWDTAWQAEESNRFGTDEFVAYCRKVGAEPYICINMGTGTMQDAADWVEYCNGTMNTAWANLRRKNGHAEPYNVKYWGLGNEIYGSWQAGHKTATEYAELALEFAKMMRWIDPDIKLIACGGNNSEWDRQLLERVGEVADYISLHHYGGNLDTAKEMDDASHLERQVRILEAVITSTPIRGEKKEPVKIAADEWNIWFRSWFKRGENHKLEEIYNLRDALWVGTALNIFHRHCNAVKLANLAQLVNVIAPIMTNEKSLVLQTTYFPLQLYAEHCQSIALDALVRSATFPNMPEAPYLDVSATTDQEGEKLTLAVVNRHPTDDITAEIVTEGLKIGTTGDLYEVNGPNLDSTNTFDAPNNVGVKKRSFSGAGPSFRQTYPAHSLSVLTLSA